MKRLLALLLSALMLAGGCSRIEKTDAGDVIKAQDKSGSAAAAKPEFTAETMPKIDGSNATIPLTEGLYQVLLGYTPEQAGDNARHMSTGGAYDNLFSGKADVIFVSAANSEYEQKIRESGLEFETVPVMLDALVFMVNNQNPVENVPLEKLRSVYAGGITNWKDLGGEDLPLIAYQHREYSDIQTMLYQTVVPEDEIMDAPTDLKSGTMDGLGDYVSDYNNGKSALGYSVYYIASDMYKDNRLLAVDGVQPTEETIRDGSYPLACSYYAVFRKDAPKDSPVRKLVDYLLSDSGQLLAESAGYIRLP